MNLIQTIDNIQNQGSQRLFVCAVFALHVGFKFLAFLVLHHQIGRIIGFKYRHDTDNIGMPEFYQRSRFTQKVTDPGIEITLRCIVERDNRVISTSFDRPARHVLFDCDSMIKVGIGRQIGDAESSVAQNFFNSVPLNQVACLQNSLVIHWSSGEAIQAVN